MAEKDLNKFGETGITKKEKEQIILLKQQELSLKNREISAIENRNKNIRILLVFLICLVFFVTGFGIFAIRYIISSRSDSSSNIDNGKLAAIQSTNTALVSTMTAVKENENLIDVPIYATESNHVTIEEIPTNTVAPTQTQYPTNTPMINTTSDTILEVGEPWIEDGKLLFLDRVNFSGGDIAIYFRILNNTPNIIQFKVEWTDLPTLIDNRGVGYEYQSLSSGTVSLDPGEEFSFSYNAYYYIELSDPGITELTVVTRGLSTMNGASWRIPVYH